MRSIVVSPGPRRLAGLLVLAAACGRGGAPGQGGGAVLVPGGAGEAIRGEAALLRGPVQALRPDTDGAPPFPLLRRDGPSPAAAVAGAERVLAAALLPGGAHAYVRAGGGGAGDLVLERDGARKVLDHEVLPALAVSSTGRLAYARRGEAGCELVLASATGGAGRVVYQGASADRVVFRDDGQALAFVGTSPAGLAALYVAPLDGPARQVTNRGLRAEGRAPGGFVPPPGSAEGMSFRGAAVRYRAPEGLYRVDVRSGAARREEAP